MKYIQPILLDFLFGIVTIVGFHDINDKNKQILRQITEDQARRTHFAVINEYMALRENWTTSNMGSWLFKHTKYVLPQPKTFYVYYEKDLIFKYFSLEGCTVKNCIFTSDDRRLPMVDAVIVWMYQSKTLFKVEYRNPKQIWIFWNDDAPSKTMAARSLKGFTNFFNWSMTYKSDADIPVPYGRTVPLEEPVLKNFDTSALTQIIPNWQRKRRDILVATMVSHCMISTENFISRLQKYTPVDVYGHCSTNATLKDYCPGYLTKDCDALSEYLFYIVIEKSSCREYLTEKIWHNAYTKGAVPIIMGPFLDDCRRLLPPNSFIYVSKDYEEADIENIYKYITNLSNNDDLLIALHQWRNHFVVDNDHWFFGRKSSWLCRICEGLNYNNVENKIYDLEDLRNYLDFTLLCV